MTGAQVRQMPLVCPGHNRGIVELQYSTPTAGGVFLISACLDGTPMLRDGTSGDWIGSFVGHKGAVWGACLSADAERAATAGADFTARLWNAVTGECEAVLPQPHICKSVAFSADGDSLLACGNDPQVRVYDVQSAQLAQTLEQKPLQNGKRSVRAARYAGSAKHTVVSCTAGKEEGVVSVWDLRAGVVVKTMELGAPAKSAELALDRKIFTVTADDATCSVYDLEKMERMMLLKVPKNTESAALRFPNMDMMVTGGHDLTVRRFEVDGKGATREAEANRGHHGPVWVTRFAPDGESYASGSDDGTIRIWKTTVDASLVAPP